MVKSKLPETQKYGVPLYGAAWAPLDHIQARFKSDQPRAEQGAEGEGKDGERPGDAFAADRSYLVLAGGGGEGSSGIPNAVLLSEFDFASGSLSQQPVAKLGTGSDLPYRMAVHPLGDGVICALPKGCRLFEWEDPENAEDHKLGLKTSEKVLRQLENAGQQLALVFSHDGSLLAAGGEDGKLIVFKWPSMDIILNEAQAHSSLKDLAFSLDGKFLVSLGNSGPCRVWDLTSSVAVASLPKENGERFGFCRFSQCSDGTQVLYVTAFTGRGESILTWNTSSWTRIGSKRVLRDSIIAFNVSADGKLLAVGTEEGDIVILNSTSMKIQTVVKKAHLGFVTALAFSRDSRAIISVSMDSSATVTQVQDTNTGGGSRFWLIIFIVLLAIAMEFMRRQGLFP
ncbi:SEC12-like protein 2 [Rhodamnia argentea]|uniref:SEC12-like protein 2 n=1 Tax=Rhodamnia argentea TaxID=178133 RepID=A0A8B8P339_9MYRT|nr:SEC12-like protein 2 [Rhodamnia argentea]